MTQSCDAPCRPNEGGNPATAPEQWRGPKGFTLLAWEVDLHAGGATRLSIKSPEGRNYLVDGVSLEIAEPERVVFSGSLDIEGESLHEAHRKVTFRRA
jgi:uncharacterized protein YndB with AHSA1/START domain